MAFSSRTDIFSDEVVSAKDLNRQPGRILDVALERPVTITRNSQAFALLPREDVTTLIQSAKVGRLAFEVTSVASRLIQGDLVNGDNPYAWLRTFDADDLKDFIAEVRSTFEQFEDSPKAWEELDSLIYEWRESSLIIDSGVLDNVIPLKNEDYVPNPETRQVIVYYADEHSNPPSPRPPRDLQTS